MKKQLQILVAAASLAGLCATQASFAAGNIAAGAEKAKAWIAKVMRVLFKSTFSD